ncbi:MAG TPA: DUF6111 family protein [Rhizomicrobium sp.]|nr:DUF6111 family protein [Rhizomicrobium sp.]
MIRILLTRLALFLLPFALYALYVYLLRFRPNTVRGATPWTGLFIAGLSLVVLSFLVLGFTEPQNTEGVYVPPYAVNGKVVPGHFEKGK